MKLGGDRDEAVTHSIAKSANECGTPQRPNRVGPEQVNNFLVRQDGVCGRTVTEHQHDDKNCYYADRKQAPAPGFSAWRGWPVGMAQMRPITSRMMTMKSTSPIPPVGA